MFRRQLPAYSPLSLGGLVRGLLGMASRAPERLESLLAERYGARRVLLTGSGTQALTLALRATGRGGEPPRVALPAYACYDVVSGAVGADARIVFYDVDPTTLGPDFDALAEVCALEPDAVVVAPLYGIPVDWDRVKETVAACGAVLVEDAAQGMGSSWKGAPLGSLGDLSVLSFGRGKGWTGGSGGAVLEHARGDRLHVPATPARSTLSVGVRTTAQWILGRPRAYWLALHVPLLALGETRYHPPTEPEGMPPLSASVALAHAEQALRECEIRRRNAAALLDRLARIHGDGRPGPITVPEGGRAGYLRLPLLTPWGMSGLSDAARARARGVMPGYPRSLPELDAARGRAFPGPPTPAARRLATQLVTAPTHRLLTAADITQIAHELADDGRHEVLPRHRSRVQ